MLLNKKALALAIGILTAGIWLMVMVFSLLTGLGQRTIATIGSYHPFFQYSWTGLIIIVIEHLLGGFIFGWLLACLYNNWAKPKPEQSL